MIAQPAIARLAKDEFAHYEIIFGPPGTGKTTTLTERVEAIVREHGPDSIMATSYTRGAAAELVSRTPQVPSTHVRTLHSFGYAAIGGNKKIAEQNILLWNREVASINDTWKMTPATKGVDGADDDLDSGGKTDGDKIFTDINVWRAQMWPYEEWPIAHRKMYDIWRDWKHQHDFVDFGDMIEIPLREQLPPPTKARFFIIDEAQDSTAQQIALVRLWGRGMEKVIIALDDDQSLYYFTGGDPEACLDLPISDENRHVLAQSHRVPRAVHAYAQRWVQTISRREKKEYYPRAFEGEVRHIEPNIAVPRDGTYIKPEKLIEDAYNRYISRGKTVMFLATCSYMLTQVQLELRRAGIPFHNHYRASRHDWNPLTPQKGVASSQRILSFLRPQYSVYGEHARMWNIEEFLEWSDVLVVDGVFRPRARKKAENYLAGLNGDRDLISRELEVTDEQLGAWLTEEALGAALDGDLEWYKDHLATSKRDGMQFPLTIVKEHGARMLMERPQVIVGTIHSVKGGQADAVYLFPDISLAANKTSTSLNQRDALIKKHGDEYARFLARHNRMRQDSIKRVFYVGMTRAYESLIICPPLPGTAKSPSPHVDLEHF